MVDTIGAFAHEWVFVIGLILGFGACGIGLVSPFATNTRLVYVSAPLAGVLAVPFGANAFYVLLRTGYARSALIAATCCLGLTLLRLMTVRLAFDRRSALFGFAGLLTISAFAVLTVDAATIWLHTPAVFYSDGTDHGGYAHLADWLNAYGIAHPPIESPDRPYESWPALVFLYDSRFGAFGLLAIIAGLHGTSAIFSYDIACAMVISAAALGVAAVFVRSPSLVILLALGLFVSHWFDYAHGGYFGKLIAFPAALFVCGLTFNSLRTPTIEQIFMLMVMSAAVGTMHSGAATAFLSMPILAAALVATAIWRDDQTMFSSSIFLCGIVIAMPLLASGVLSRPLLTGYPDYGLQWSYVMPRILDLENQGVSLSGMSPAWIEGQVAVAVLVWGGLLALAIIGRNVCAAGLLGGPAVLLIGIVAAGANAIAFQLIGYFYPAIVCGAFALATDERATRTIRTIVLALAVLTVAQRLPRFAGAVDRYAVHQNQQYLFSAAELDRLARDIGSETVRIDVAEPVPGILLLVELGRRRLDLEWSPRGWHAVLRYRGWPLPVRAKLPTMTLRLSNEGPFDHFALERLPDR